MDDQPSVKYDYLLLTTMYPNRPPRVQVHRALPSEAATLCKVNREPDLRLLDEAWENAEPFTICQACRDTSS